MKPINKWTCLLGAMLSLSACSNEETSLSIPTPGEGQIVKIQMCIDPTDTGEAVTRAGGDQKVPVGYQLRCIVAAYDNKIANGQPITTSVSYMDAGSSLEKSHFTEELRLTAGTEYLIVAWADYVKDGAPETDLYYDTGDLKAIKQTTVTEASDGKNAEDAYWDKASYTTGSDVTQTTISLTLKRPLAKVELENVIFNAASGAEKYRMNYAITDKPETSAPTFSALTFNALTGEVQGNTGASSLFQSTNDTGTDKVEKLYSYIFCPATGITTVRLAVENSDGIKTYGMGNGTGSDISLLIERNSNVLVKGASGNLTLYERPSQP